MSAIPSYQVYTKRKLENNPDKKRKSFKRLGYRQFREGELEQLDEVLHDANLDLAGIYAIKTFSNSTSIRILIKYIIFDEIYF